MKTRKQLSIGLFLLATISASLQAESRRYGYVTVPLLSGSDTYLSVPFNNQVAARGVLGAPAVQGSGFVTLALAGEDPGWSDNEYADQHYVRFLDGPLEGLHFTVGMNDSSALVIEDRDMDFSGVGIGHQIELAPYLTLDSVFPPSSTSLTQTVGRRSSGLGSLVLLFSNDDKAVNKAPSELYNLTDLGWSTYPGGQPAGDKILHPDSSFVIRQPSSTVDVNLSFLGLVDQETLTVEMQTSSSEANDVYISLNRPTPVTLLESNIQSGFAPTVGSRSSGLGDLLLTFDNSDRAVNKAPSHIFKWTGSEWLEAVENADHFVIDPATTLVVRKKVSDGISDFAVTTPTF